MGGSPARKILGSLSEDSVQFNSVLTLTGGGVSAQVEGSVLQDCPRPPLLGQREAPGCYLWGLQVGGSSSLFRFD